MEHNRQNPDARAALLSGPPGVGKTTTAHVVAAECGFEVMELNASDKRSMTCVREALRASVQSLWVVVRVCEIGHWTARSEWWSWTRWTA